MASTINASTSPAAIVQTADGTANLNLQSNGTTIAALTSTGMAVTGTLSASGVITATGGLVVGAAAAPAFSVNLVASTTISTSTYVKLPFNSELIDTNSNYDQTTNYRFTPTVAGYYQATVFIIAGSATATFCIIYKNGVQQTPGTIGGLLSGIGLAATASGLFSMNGTTDYIEAYAYQTGNGSISGGVGGCNFSGFLARSA